MHPVLLSFADGSTFFVGVVLVWLAEALILCSRKRWVRSLLIICAALGVILVVLSATPLAGEMYLGWGVLALLGLFVLGRPIRRSFTLLITGAFSLMSIAMLLLEFPYRSVPQIQLEPDQIVYVIGDSVSAGIGANGSRSWPELLEERTGYHVVNCAVAGATVESALKQLSKVVDAGSLVILEIGGNDLLGHTEVSDFGVRLDALIAGLVDQHQVLMLELPLLPFKNAYGVEQRKVAARYNLTMVPKHVFTRVFGAPGATTDGLHLSPTGNEVMAEQVALILGK